ncbi:hypothetical protein AVEN_170568-1 [Araneus ventricosus]|uniref:Uncharacterized protein n=1 Tax=Araneus ventricosus TaxID=182803 RepID=A0A4Y2SM43_ARAVE|nr:hypothetical protein AVEN_170568-1 [Araneus ventricosus]
MEDRAEIVDHLSGLDAKMQSILQRKDLLESVKVNQYLQVLQKFVKIQHPQQQVETTEVQVTSISENQEPETVPEDVITKKKFKVCPSSVLKYCKEYFRFLKVNHSILSWTSEGEIVYNGQRMPRTNIMSLVTDLLRDRKKSPS